MSLDLVPSTLQQQIFGMDPQIKVLLMPRDPEGVLPTHVSGNRLTNLSTSCRPCNSLWTCSSPSWQWSGAPGEHWLGQSPTEGQESFCGSLGFQRRSSSTPSERESEKKREFGEIGVDRQTAWLCLHRPSPKVAQARTKWDLFGLRFLPWGKERLGEWALGLSSCVGHCQWDSFLSRSIQSPKSGALWLEEEGNKKKKKWQINSQKVALKGHCYC